MAQTSKEKAIEKKTIADYRAAKRRGKLDFPQHLRCEGYHYFFPLETPERVSDLQAIGYNVVDPKLERNKPIAQFFGCSGSSKITRRGDAGATHILMEVPLEVKAILDQIKREEVDDTEAQIESKIDNNPNLFKF